MVESILPPHSGRLETALDALAAKVVGFDVPISALVDPELCPVQALPWLADYFSVDTWDENWSVDVKRSVISSSIQVHRVKGTRGSVRRALAAAGYPNAVIVEGFVTFPHDGTRTRDGTQTYGVAESWAEYRVYVNRPVSIAQSEKIRGILAEIAPARSRLAELDFTQASNIYNGLAPRDGTFTRGVV